MHFGRYVWTLDIGFKAMLLVYAVGASGNRNRALAAMKKITAIQNAFLYVLHKRYFRSQTKECHRT